MCYNNRNLFYLIHLTLHQVGLSASNCNKWTILGKIGTFTHFYEYKFSFWTQTIIKGRQSTRLLNSLN